MSNEPHPSEVKTKMHLESLWDPKSPGLVQGAP